MFDRSLVWTFKFDHVNRKPTGLDHDLVTLVRFSIRNDHSWRRV